METIATGIALYIYGTMHILVGFVPLPFSNFFFPRTRLELFFDGPHAELKGRIIFGGLLRYGACIGLLRGVYIIAFGSPWTY